MKRIYYALILLIGLAFAMQGCSPKSCNAEELSLKVGMPNASVVEITGNKDFRAYLLTHNGFNYIVVYNGAGLAIARE